MIMKSPSFVPVLSTDKCRHSCLVLLTICSCLCLSSGLERSVNRKAWRDVERRFFLLLNLLCISCWCSSSSRSFSWTKNSSRQFDCIPRWSFRLRTKKETKKKDVLLGPSLHLHPRKRSSCLVSSEKLLQSLHLISRNRVRRKSSRDLVVNLVGRFPINVPLIETQRFL